MTGPPRFVDTSVLIRLLTQDDEERARRSTTLFLRVEDGEERIVLSTLVIFETIFTLHRSFRVPRHDIRKAILNIIEHPGVQLSDKHLFVHALDLFVERNISFADAYHAAFMISNGLTEIYSWDRHFDRIGDIERVEPE